MLILFLIGTRWCTTSFEINKLQHQGYVLASYCFLKEIGKNHINKCKDPLRILIIFPLNSHSKEHQAEVACSVFLISQRMIRKWISFLMRKCEKIVTFSSLLSKRCNFVAVGDYWLVERFRLSVVNTKPKLSQDPIRRWENNCKNRWELARSKQWTVQSEGKRGWPSRDWLWFCTWLVERVAQVLLDQSQSGEKQNQCNPEYFRHSVVNCSNLKTTQVTTRCTPEEYGSHTFNFFYFFRLLDEYHNMIVLDKFFYTTIAIIRTTLTRTFRLLPRGSDYLLYQCSFGLTFYLKGNSSRSTHLGKWTNFSKQIKLDILFALYDLL